MVIGLEVHAQLKSASKIFCPDAVEYGAPPNTLVSPISLAHPGTLPTFNVACMDMAIKMGLALNCEIDRDTHFARKNYFYPDLPKGYQISQDATPICREGQLLVRLEDGTEKNIGIERIHMEEDAGKNLHDQALYHSLVDFNRVGTGLIEIVSKPDMRSPEEAMAYLTEIRKIVRFIGVCDGNMEEGSLRADANISVMREGATEFGTRAEVKNVNSISNIGRAIRYEVERQIEILESGGVVQQQTRTWDAANGKTHLLRIKEDSDDYRYFPEPDLQPIHVTDEQLERLQSELPKLPRERYLQYTQEFGLPDHDATLLTEQREFAEYFEAVLAHTDDHRAVSNWLNGSVKSYLNERALDITDFPMPPQQLAGIIQLVNAGKVNISMAKEKLFPALLEEPAAKPEAKARELNLIMDADEEALLAKINEILDAEEEKVRVYNAGKDGLLGYFVGQMMRAFKGKADPKQINTLLRQELHKRREE